MKTIKGQIISSKPISITKAASSLSNFIAAETGASQAVAAYLRRATVAFEELVQLPSRKKQKKQELNGSVKEEEIHHGESKTVNEDVGKIGMGKSEIETGLSEGKKESDNLEENIKGEFGNNEENGGKMVIEEDQKKKKRKSREENVDDGNERSNDKRKKKKRRKEEN